MESGAARKKVGPADLRRVGLAAARYSLHDLAWSPAGDRLAFSWLDAQGWGQVAISGPNGALVPLHAPIMDDPWEEGAVFNLSASTFLWDAGGSSGTFVGWDDDCGTLYRTAIPEPGSWGGAPVAAPKAEARETSKSASSGGPPTPAPPAAPTRLPLPSGCRTNLAGTPGFWLYTELDEEFTHRLAVVDDAGVEVESLTFPQGSPLRVRWGCAAAGAPDSPASRPPILVWWYDADRHERKLLVWMPGSLVEWLREPCADGCAEPASMTASGVLFLDGPPGAARLMLLESPGAAPVEVLPAPVSDLAPSPGGSGILAVRSGGGGSSLWLQPIPPRQEPPGDRSGP